MSCSSLHSKGFTACEILSISVALTLNHTPPGSIPNYADYTVRFLSKDVLFSSRFSVSTLTTVDSQVSIGNKVFGSSLALVGSPSGSSLGQGPPVQRGSSVPIGGSGSSGLHANHFSSTTTVYSQHGGGMHPRQSNGTSRGRPGVSLSNYMCYYPKWLFGSSLGGESLYYLGRSLLGMGL